MGFSGGSDGKESACNVGDLGSLGWEDPLEEGMATLSSILAWRTPWTEEPGRLQSMGLQRVGHDIVTKQNRESYFLASTSHNAVKFTFRVKPTVMYALQQTSIIAGWA